MMMMKQQIVAAGKKKWKENEELLNLEIRREHKDNKSEFFHYAASQAAPCSMCVG